MSTDLAEACLGLCGGALGGVSLRVAYLTIRADAVMLAVSLTLLFTVVTGSCAVAWTSFAEYVGRSGWLWFAAGLLLGLMTGEAAVLWRTMSRHRGRPGHRE